MCALGNSYLNFDKGKSHEKKMSRELFEIFVVIQIL